MFDKREPSQFEIAADLKALEARLRQLSPKPAAIERDRLMFAAGRVAERAEIMAGRSHGDELVTPVTRSMHRQSRTAWGWPTATAVMTAATLLLATTLAWRESERSHGPETASLPTPVAVQKSERVNLRESDNEVEMASSVLVSHPAIGRGYFELRNIALTQGVNALPSIPSASAWPSSARDRMSPVTARELLEELAPESAGSI